MTTKRQQTMAKITRERAVREKRERKLEKKRAAKAERKALGELGQATPGVDGVVESPLEPGTPESASLLDAHESNGDDGPVPGERVVPGL